MKKPSRAKKSFLGFSRNTGTQAAARMMRMEDRKGMGFSPYSRATPMGSSMAAASMSRVKPVMRRTSLKFIASAPRPQAAALVNVVQIQNAAVPGHHDHVVPALQGGGALRDDHPAPPDDDGDEHALLQPQVLQRHP